MDERPGDRHGGRASDVLAHDGGNQPPGPSGGERGLRLGKTVASLTQTATPRHPAKPSAAKHPAACRRSAWAEPQDARWPEALCGWGKGSEGARTGKRRRPWLRWGRREAARASAWPLRPPRLPGSGRRGGSDTGRVLGGKEPSLRREMSRMGFGCPASEQKYLPGRDPAGPLRLSPERKCTSRGHYRTSAVTRGFRGATERSPGIGVPGPRFAKGREPPGYTGPFPAAPHFPGPTGTASPLGVQRPCHRALRSHHGAGRVSCVKKPRERQREQC